MGTAQWIWWDIRGDSCKRIRNGKTDAPLRADVPMKPFKADAGATAEVEHRFAGLEIEVFEGSSADAVKEASAEWIWWDVRRYRNRPRSAGSGP